MNFFQYFVTIESQMSPANHSLYIRKNDKEIVVTIIYMDGLIVGDDNNKEIKEVKDLLMQKFDMTNLDDLKIFYTLKLSERLKVFDYYKDNIQGT